VTGRVRIEVSDRHGTAAEVIDPAAVLGKLTARQRARLGTLASGLARDLAAILGCAEGHARRVAMAEVVRVAADDAAYERVAEQRGLLAL
jgi:hypothetical protein